MSGDAKRRVVTAPEGMVACAHPAAAELGVAVLREGGNAVDAAIAMNAALGFCEPTACGIGGDLFAMVWDPATQRLHGLNASGRCPATLTPEQVTPAAHGSMDFRSPASWTVPGAVDGWSRLHERFGSVPMATLLAGPIVLAREGVRVPPVIAAQWARAADVLGGMPGFDETFLLAGRAPAAGERFANPALAETYEAIAAGGRDAFYRGAVAADVETFSRTHGGFLTAADLAAHTSDWVDPVSTDYRGVTIWELPPNGQGLAALQMLNILETFDVRAMGRDDPAWWHGCIEAKKLAFADRARWYADPAFARVPVAGLLDKGYARLRAALIDPARAAERDAFGDPGGIVGDTTYLAAADRHGAMCSLIQSNYTGFGSGHAVRGFGLQNRATGFSLDSASPNVLAPGKRPFHTIIPAFATRDGEPWLAFGVMGGDMQPQGHVQIVMNLVDFDLDLQAAGDAPRWRHVGSSQPTGTVMTDGGTVHLEDGVPDAVRDGLRERGHRLRGAAFMGGYQAVARAGDGWLGATESRKDGCALGY